MKYTLISLLLLNCAVSFTQNAPEYISEVWQADLGNGTYKNPILYADYSDPDVVRVGDNYYMTASSFNCAPGLPILHSKDMVNWKLVNHALPRQVPEDVFAMPQHGNGVWAPSIRFHDGEFYIYWGDPDFGIYMVKTKNPHGAWEPPVLVMPGKGLIDPSPLWDTDGNAYLVHAYAGSRRGVKSLVTVNRMNAAGTKVLDQGVHVFDGHEGNPTVEGTKFYKRNGYYYIFAPAGGVSTGWQLILRAKHIYGPYEQKVVLEQGSTSVNGPHQGAWVQTPEGKDWFYHFQDLEAYGRVVHLQPMRWEDDWPVMGRDLDGNGIGEPVASHKKPHVGHKHPLQSPAESDEFNTNTIGPQWQWQANPDVVWHAKIRGEQHLRLFAIKPPEETANLWEAPHLLLQKFPAPEFTATTKISLVTEGIPEGKSAGLIIMGMDYATLTLTHDEKGYILRQTEAIDAINGQGEKTVAEKRLNRGTDILIRVQVSAPHAVCRFSYSVDGKSFESLGSPFAAKPGKWIGAKVGLFCNSTLAAKRGGYADIDWFRIQK